MLDHLLHKKDNKIAWDSAGPLLYISWDMFKKLNNLAPKKLGYNDIYVPLAYIKWD